MKLTDEKQWLDKLAKEGFADLTVHEANKEWPEHTHEQYTVHVILAGSLITKDSGGVNNYGPGDRFDIPAGGSHTAKCGPNGCKFIVGIKK